MENSLQVHWIIDKDLFSEYTEKLAKAVEESGMVAHIFDEYKETRMSSFLYKNFKNEPIILHGSFDQAETFNKNAFYPGVYLNLENYECSNYYGYYGYELLNKNYKMMGLNDVRRNYRAIFKSFDTDKIFIRPSNGYKSFSGQLLSFNNFESEFDILTKSYGGLDMRQLVVLAPYQEIINEYRFIIVNGKVITGSLYMDKESRKTNTPIFDRPCKLHHPAAIYAKYLSTMYTPDNAYTIDIAENDSGFSLLEINSFCCANMYGANLNEVVSAINKQVLLDYIN